MDRPCLGVHWGWSRDISSVARLPARANPHEGNFRKLTRFSRYFSAAGADVAQRQEAQIVQSCNTLDDFLPGFGPLSLCRLALTHSRCPSDRVSLRPFSRHSSW